MLTAWGSFGPIRTRPPDSVAAAAMLKRLTRREARIRQAYRRRFAAGWGVLVAVTVMSLLPVAWWASASQRLPPATVPVDPSAPVPTFRRPSSELVRLTLGFDGAIAVLMFPVAILVKRQSRADVAQRILDHGCQSPAARENPLLAAVLVVVALGMLYGEFLILDGLRAARVVGRVRHVDRHRAALVLVQLRDDPMGTEPRLLLRAGESPAAINGLIAYLVVNEWADVNRRGTRLTARRGS